MSTALKIPNHFSYICPNYQPITMDHKRPKLKKECKPFDKVCIDRAKSFTNKKKGKSREFKPAAGKIVTPEKERAVEHKMTEGGKTFIYWKGTAKKKSTFPEREAMRAAWRKKNKGVADKDKKRLTDAEVQELRKKLNLK